MSLFTIFHSRDFTAIDPGWHPPGYCICSRFTSPEMVNEEERDGEANGAQFFTRSFCCSSYCSNSPHFQMSPAVAFLFPSLLRNTSITATGPRGPDGGYGKSLGSCSGGHLGGIRVPSPPPSYLVRVRCRERDALLQVMRF